MTEQISIIRHSTPAAKLLSNMWVYEPKEDEQVASSRILFNLGPNPKRLYSDNTPIDFSGSSARKEMAG